MTLIDFPDVDSWRQRLAVLLDGIDLDTNAGRSDAWLIVDEAARQTTVNGLRRIAVALGGPRRPLARSSCVAAVVDAWASLPADQRSAPAATAAERRDAAEDVSDLAGLYASAVGTSREAEALRRLRDAVDALRDPR